MLATLMIFMRRRMPREMYGKWLVVFIHTLNGGSDSCWGNWDIDMWGTYLDYLKTRIFGWTR